MRSQVSGRYRIWQRLGRSEAVRHYEQCADIADPDLQLRQLGYNVMADERFRAADAWLLVHPLGDSEYAERARVARDGNVGWARSQLLKMGFDDETARTRARLVYMGYLGIVADVAARQEPIGESEGRRLIDDLMDLVTDRAPDRRP